MPRQTLSDRSLKALKPAPKGQRYELRDSIVPGLLVRVTEKGTRTFMLQSRFPGSTQPTRRAIGEYGSVSLERAREKARNWIELVHKGIDPAVVEEEERQANLRLQPTRSRQWQRIISGCKSLVPIPTSRANGKPKRSSGTFGQYSSHCGASD